MNKLCLATEEEYKKVGCERDTDNCNMCCIFHECKHKWKDTRVWKKCEFFSRGSCGFQET